VTQSDELVLASGDPPDGSSTEGLAPWVLARVLHHVAANLGRDLGVSELAAVAQMSPHHFSLCFKRSMGVTPHKWVVHRRVAEARRLLRAGSMPVVDVALSLGFSNQSHFTDVFRRLTGTTPKRYQRLHAPSIS
jgi:AraC family transcriptional regulator